MTPPAESFPPELTAAAHRRGVQLSYYDVFGRAWSPSPAVVAAIVDALGPEPAAGERGIVITPGVAIAVEPGSVLRLESGDERAVETLDETLPWGYHTLLRPGQPKVPVAVCPARMWRPEGSGRAAGVAIALYGLRSKRNWGVGDFRDLAQFCQWAATRLGVQFVALNPLHAIHNREPYNASPYLPLSSYFRNFLYLDLEQLAEYSAPSVRAWADGDEVQAEIRRLRASEYVDYEGCAALKFRFLWRAYQEQQSAASPDFGRFVTGQGPDLERFCLFCALDQYFRETRPGTWLWTDWPAEYHSPDSPASRAFAIEHASILRFYAWIQWLIEGQLAQVQALARSAGMSIGLYHDLALATDRYGADVWAAPDRFVARCRVGSPPDEFSPEGQDWAFPPPHSGNLAREGFRSFAQAIRRNATPGGALRLDHVMRLFRLFWIPDSYSAREGTYVQEPWRELLGVLALESHRGHFRVIGEDLGTVTDEIRRGLTEAGILGYRLLMFEKEGGRFRSPQEYPANAVAAVTTHDLATLAGFWLGRDIEARRDAGLLPGEQSYWSQVTDRTLDRQRLLDALHAAGVLPSGFPQDARQVSSLPVAGQRAVLAFLAATPCELFVINQEELTGEEYQQNLPGSTAQYPNWKRKMSVAVDELDQLDVDWLAELLRRYGRATP